jgi:hypothetical protein
MPKPLLIDWSQVRATASATGSLADAARLHGISVASVKMRAMREKWNTPKRALAKVAQAKAEAVTVCQPVTVVTPTASEAIERHMAEHRDTFRTNIATALSKAAKHAANLDPAAILESSRKVADIAQAGSKIHGLGAPETQVAVQVLNSW